MQTRTEEYPLSDTWQISERISEMMRDIDSRPEWHEEVSRGKMFGLLIYRDKDGNEGMLKAYSGQICGRSDWPGYVPAVFDYLQPDGYFKQEEAAIVRLHDAGQPTRERSQALQRWLFTQTVLTGAHGERRSVLMCSPIGLRRTTPSRHCRLVARANAAPPSCCTMPIATI